MINDEQLHVTTGTYFVEPNATGEARWYTQPSDNFINNPNDSLVRAIGNIYAVTDVLKEGEVNEEGAQMSIDSKSREPFTPPLCSRYIMIWDHNKVGKSVLVPVCTTMKTPFKSKTTTRSQSKLVGVGTSS